MRNLGKLVAAAGIGGILLVAATAFLLGPRDEGVVLLAALGAILTLLALLPLAGAIMYATWWHDDGVSARANLPSEGEPCPSCGKLVAIEEKEKKWCPYCAHDLDEGVDCAKCGEELKPGFVYCPYCKERRLETAG